jgi:PHD/YefM family antitoxin component YafN of YafNO toxin-antitoxin module
MKIIELTVPCPSLEDLVETTQQVDVLLLRAGKPVAVLSKFSREDWEEWQMEHSPAAMERSRKAREEYRQGRCKTISEVEKSLGIEPGKPTP